MFHRKDLQVNQLKEGVKRIIFGDTTLLSFVAKVFYKVLNITLVQHFDKGGELHEGQACVQFKEKLS